MAEFDEGDSYDDSSVDASETISDYSDDMSDYSADSSDSESYEDTSEMNDIPEDTVEDIDDSDSYEEEYEDTSETEDIPEDTVEDVDDSESYEEEYEDTSETDDIPEDTVEDVDDSDSYEEEYEDISETDDIPEDTVEDVDDSDSNEEEYEDTSEAEDIPEDNMEEVNDIDSSDEGNENEDETDDIPEDSIMENTEIEETAEAEETAEVEESEEAPEETAEAEETAEVEESEEAPEETAEAEDTAEAEETEEAPEETAEAEETEEAPEETAEAEETEEAPEETAEAEDTAEAEETEEAPEETAEAEEAPKETTEAEESEEAPEETAEAEDTAYHLGLKGDEYELLKSGNNAINQRLEAQADDYRDKGLSEEEIQDKLALDRWNYQKEFLNDAFPGQDVSPNVFNGFSENGAKDRIQEIQTSDSLRNELTGGKSTEIIESGSNNKVIVNDITDPEKHIFSGFETGNHRYGSDVFVKGDHFDEFENNYYNSEQSRYVPFDEHKEIDISPSLIEGIHLGQSEAQDASKFWSQHESGGTADSFREIAVHIPEVRERMEQGTTLDELSEDPDLSECANIYFKNKPQVVEHGDYYEFDTNGRHRILAARSLGMDIPVEVIGKREDISALDDTTVDKNVENPGIFRDRTVDSQDGSESIARSDINEQAKEYNQQLKDYCEKNGYVNYADFSDFDPHVAYDLANSVAEAKRDFPDLEVGYLGSIDNQVSGIRTDLSDGMYENYKAIEGITDEQARQMADAYADNYIKQSGLDDCDGTYAWSYKSGNSLLSKYNGVAVNNEYASDYKHFAEEKADDVLQKWAPEGCGSPKAVTDHELGHEIDRLVGAESDLQINEMYKKMISDGNAKEKLSQYSATNVREFIAESYSEYKNNPKPRETSVSVYKRLIELRDQKILEKEKALHGR